MTTLKDSEFRQAVLDAAGRMQEKLIRYSSRFFGGDEEAARDIVQHAFLQLCRAEPETRPQKIDQWLYRVCRNRAIDTCRARQRQQSECQQSIDLQTDAGKNAFDKLSEKELNDLVRQRLALLPDSQGEAIELWSFGVKYSQIAEIMARPESSIRVLVHRGLSKLKSDPTIQGWLGQESSTEVAADSISQKSILEGLPRSGLLAVRPKAKVEPNASPS